MRSRKNKKDLSLDIMIAHKNKTKQVDTAWRQFKMIDTDARPYISDHLLTERDFILNRERLYNTDKFDFLESMWALEYILDLGQG